MKTPYDRLLDRITAELRAKHPTMATQKLFDEAERLAGLEREEQMSERSA